jgi:glycosyltransferase involved in cell wall biosynthesis
MTADPGRSLHAVQLSFFRDPQDRAPGELLAAWPTLADVAEATAQAGVTVSVVQASGRRARMSARGVNYYFQPFGSARTPARPGAPLAQLLAELRPDVLHVHGLAFPRETAALARLVPAIPLVVQDHASRPPRPWRRLLWRRGLAAAAALAFCAREQAEPFVAARVLDPATPVYEIPESTSRFSAGDRAEARRDTGIVGEPALLWVGHLDENKDPLTVLAGVSEAGRHLPDLRLYCCFGTGPLLAAVQARIAGDAGLRGRVELLGRVSHERIEELMRAADLFVLGSHHEGSGYSLIEALACGLPPVVTDIPSFRALTGRGAVGRLWPCGDAAALAGALAAMAPEAGAARAPVRAYFERELSFAAVGRRLSVLYARVRARP